jgi:hypothetical protein
MGSSHIVCVEVHTYGGLIVIVDVGCVCGGGGRVRWHAWRPCYHTYNMCAMTPSDHRSTFSVYGAPSRISGAAYGQRKALSALDYFESVTDVGRVHTLKYVHLAACHSTCVRVRHDAARLRLLRAQVQTRLTNVLRGPALCGHHTRSTADSVSDLRQPEVHHLDGGIVLRPSQQHVLRL